MSYLTYGNRKLPSSTAIFNITSSTECPSKKLGYCAHANKCYALKAERLYPQVLPFRKRQNKLFDMLSGTQLGELFLMELSGRKNPVDKLRFSEAGDFRSQGDVEKFTQCARLLNENGVKVYGYTARQDLDFGELQKFATINGNNFQVTNTVKVVDRFTGKTGVVECPANCNICDACATEAGKVIEIKKH